MIRHYYAAQMPRGFRNEIDVYRFAKKKDRDEWVERHMSDGDCESARLGAWRIRSKTAKSILAEKPEDDVFGVYHTFEDEPLGRERCYDKLSTEFESLSDDAKAEYWGSLDCYIHNHI